ncbi:hypothetical protein F5B22DRAFT_592952 [Xylaria bambusicola]|uniref:uncharacterized protein n=1 Tax=Xylaria bambusicola TaxID=326684 RepID=UPI00200774BC|nr:uncharacterized protein F5B22DRAFT_592952 [Xylaria bambusicola]KAI0522141.1 hypothetical protein F5B22DRAFT_592952 [Xylaria bambusicola]
MTPRHNCGCEATNDALPKLVAFFRSHGHEAQSYSNETPIPEGLGLESACWKCQLNTETGVETAITALHCGPDILITHDVVEVLFLSLIRLRLQEGDDDSSASGESEESDAQDEVASLAWDWDNIWHEFAKAFELRRNSIDVAKLLHNLSELESPRHQKWWVSVLRGLGAEALLTYEDYISSRLTKNPGASVLSVMRRDAKIVQSVDDLFDLYVAIDTKVHGYVHAHKMLRVKCLCCR